VHFYTPAGTITDLLHDLLGLDNRAEKCMTRRQIKLEPERVMADVCLGVTVAGLYTLVGMGLIIAFM
jgi:hypothetical protein